MSEKKPMKKARKVLLVTIAALAIVAGGVWYAQTSGMPGGALATSQPVTQPVTFRPLQPVPQTQSAVANAGTGATHQVQPGLVATAAPSPNAATTGAVVPTARPAMAATSLAGGEQVEPEVAQGMPAANAATNVDATVVDSSFFSNESTLQRQLRLLKLREQIRELQNKLNKLDGHAPQVNTKPATVTVSAPAATPGAGGDAVTTKTVSSVPITPLPVLPTPRPIILKSVLGVGSSYTAVIADHGVSEAVHVGDHLRGGWAVTSIWPRHVVLSRGGDTKVVRLGD